MIQRMEIWEATDTGAVHLTSVTDPVFVPSVDSLINMTSVDFRVQNISCSFDKEGYSTFVVYRINVMVRRL